MADDALVAGQFRCPIGRGTDVWSVSQSASGLFGEETGPSGMLTLQMGSMVRGSRHFLISQCPSANEKLQAPL
jgi:hypothetical protein